MGPHRTHLTVCNVEMSTKMLEEGRGIHFVKILSLKNDFIELFFRTHEKST